MKNVLLDSSRTLSSQQTYLPLSFVPVLKFVLRFANISVLSSFLEQPTMLAPASFVLESEYPWYIRVSQVLAHFKLWTDERVELECEEWMRSGNRLLQAMASIFRCEVPIQRVYCWECCGVTECLVIENILGDQESSSSIDTAEWWLCKSCRNLISAQLIDVRLAGYLRVTVRELRSCALKWKAQSESSEADPKDRISDATQALFEATLKELENEGQRSRFVEHLNLSIRAQNFLAAMRIEKIEQLCDKSEQELREERGCTDDVLASIRAGLQQKNRKLKND